MHPEIIDSVKARIPTPEGEFQLYHYGKEKDGKEHLALVYGDVRGLQDVLIRVHSECFTGDVLGSLRCDCGPQLQKAMEMIAHTGRGVVIYLRQEGRGIGLAEKLRAYNLQDEGYDTVEANLMLGHQADERRYQPAAAILQELGVASIRLMTNNPKKIEGLTALGITVAQRIPIETDITPENKGYLQTKVSRMRHMLNLTNGHGPTPNLANSNHSSSLSSIHENCIHEPTPNTTQNGSHTNGPHTNGSHTANPPAVKQQLQALRQRIEQHQNPERPFITLSYAQSLDGSITAKRGQPTAISGAESMAVTHAIRASHDAILVGINTILADDPRLNVRLAPGKSPVPIVLDSQLRIPSTARLFDAHEQVIIATTQPEDHPKVSELQARGATFIHLSGDPRHRVPLNDLLMHIRQQRILSIMVEGGSSVISSFLTNQLIDHLAVTIAPTYVGGLNVLHTESSPPQPPKLPTLDSPAWTPVGSDLILWGAITK